MTDTSLNLSIVIPNYNGEVLLKKYLHQVILIASRYPEVIEVIVVDDMSEDKSVEVIRNEKKKTKSEKVIVELLENQKHLGFSSTANNGVKAAKGDIVVLLNTDVVPEKEFLRHVLPHFADGKLFGVGFMDKSIEHGKTILRGRGIGEWKKGMYIHRRGEVDQTDTAWISGGSSAIRRVYFLKLGGFDQRFNPFYWEDIDLSYRAVKNGYKILFESKSVVNHYHEEGAILSKFSKDDITRIAYRNQFIFVWKNANLGQFVLHVIWLPYHMINASRRKDGEFFSGFFTALARYCHSMLYYKLWQKNMD